MHITRIKTNIKRPGGMEFSNLGPNVFVLGPNGSGKTGLMSGIYLPLFGEVRELGGRDKAKAVYLLDKLLPPGEKSLYAEIEMSDGTVYNWEWVPGSRAKMSNMPYVVSPMPDAQKALTGSRDTAVRFLFREFCNPGDIDTKLLAMGGRAYDTFAAQFSKGNAIWNLLSTEASAATATANHNKKVKEIGTAISVYEAYAQLPAPDELVLAAEGARRAAKDSSEVAKHCMKVMARAINSAKVRICGHISEYLHGHFTFYLDDTRFFGGFNTGSGTDMSVRPAVSGAEFIRICAAICAAIADRHPGEYVLIDLPDKAMDDVTLTRLMDKLRHAKANCFIQSPEPPEWGLEDGWTPVEMHSLP